MLKELGEKYVKILLTTLNARYIHTSLSLLYLEKFCSKYNKDNNIDIMVKEYTINDNLLSIAADIYETEAKIIAFSSYIWNIEMTLLLADIIKKIRPQSTIIFGGPEVSYDPNKILTKYSFIDYVIMGEGEQTLSHLIRKLCKPKDERYTNISQVKGIAYRDIEDNIIINKPRRLIENLDTIPSPYNSDDIKRLEGKILYYETSRGCPFDCTYCLSSTIKGVRYFSYDRIKSDLLFLINNKIKLIKFVDRTFNCDKKRAKELFEFLYKNRQETSFHFEIAGHLLDDDTINFLKDIEKDVFQFEIGVQSTNCETINAINRKTDFGKLSRNVRKLRKADNIHLHLDLIAGLPYESYQLFEKSFNDVYKLAPHMLQLGFLKLLKGSRIRKEEEKYKYKYISQPPYEVLSNDLMTYDEMLKLKSIENVLDKYYNSGTFNKSLHYIIQNFYIESPFKFYEEIGQYFKNNKLDKVSHSRRTLYDILYKFYNSKFKIGKDTFSQYLKFDLLKNNRGAKMFSWGEREYNKDFKNICYGFLKDVKNIKQYLPQYTEEPVREIVKKVDFHIFNFNVLEDDLLKRQEKKENIILFDYGTKIAVNVTNKI